MNKEVNADEHLVEHYTVLNNLKSDFRNYNLFNLVALMVKGKDVVDIGCGVASFAKILKERGKEVTGIEPSAGMRALAAKINPEVIIIPGTAENIDTIVTKPVDTVIMLDVLEHIENDIKQVKKIWSILKTEGEFIFVVPSHQFLYGERDKQMGHYRRYSKKILKNLLLNNGFQIKFLRHWNVLGFIPYLISEKILHKPLDSKLRLDTSPGTFSAFMQKILNFWFDRIENNFDLGFGLSIIGVAKKNPEYEGH